MIGGDVVRAAYSPATAVADGLEGVLVFAGSGPSWVAI
jgi:hypothetical protein